MIRVASVWRHHRREGEERVYVGRTCRGYPGSPLGNPYRGGDALSNYETWLRSRIQERDPKVVAELIRIAELSEVRDVTLLCWCAKSSDGLLPEDPLICHAQIVGRVVGKIAMNAASKAGSL